MPPTASATARPRLSVVVPCHNAARFLPTTLASAQNNAADDIEWIFVDDGSRDDTGAVLTAFQPRRGTATVLTNPDALGLAGARNTGTAAATGRYVTYLDADDWYGPGYLTRLADAIEELGVDFVRTDHVQATGLKRTTHRAPEARRWTPIAATEGIGTRPDRTTMVDYPYAWSAVYDLRLRDAGLLAVDQRIHTAEDRLMAWRLHLHARSFAVIGLLGYFYRRAVTGSLTQIGDERQLHFFESFDLIRAELATSSAFAAFEPKFVRNYLAVIAHHELQRDRLHREVHREFRARARCTIAGLPPDLVADTIRSMEGRRARVLGRLR